MPTSAAAFYAAIKALALLGWTQSAFPFLAGLLIATALWLFGRYCVVDETGPASWAGALSRRFYVFGHELTHALAAWSVGGKVHGFKVGDAGGPVDLSHSNAFIALAPYCFPIYTLGVILIYRGLVYWKPSASNPMLFLLFVGLTLAFHGLKTFEVLWDGKQPDLQQAGGVIFSIAWIGLANGAVVLLLMKGLFPGSVALGAESRLVWERTLLFWSRVWQFLKPLTNGFASQLKHP
jgi:hypothetical protein